MSLSGSTSRVALAAGVWLVALIAGFAGLERYASAAGDARAPAPGLIDALAPYRHSGRALAVMAIHPRCPCTEASLAEFADFVARAGPSCDALIVHVVPSGAGADWPLAEGRRLGQRDVPVVADPDGQLAAQLGAETSGHIVLVDASGEIRFHGGITRSRGHRGRAPAQDAMLAVVAGHAAPAELCSAPVYGCALRGPCERPAPASP